MRGQTRWIAGLAAAAILLTATVSASAYTGQVAATATVAVSGSITCDEPFTLTATFVDVDGVPVPDLSVDWSFVSSQTGDQIGATPTTTNADGVATTSVTLAATTGERTIRASTAEVSASAVVSQLCGGLPRTSTLPATGLQFPTLILLLGLVAAAAGAWLAVWRRA